MDARASDKQALRMRARAQRAQAAQNESQAPQRLAQQFCAHVLPGAPKITCVAGYMPKADELDVRPLLHELARHDIALALPKLIDNKMHFVAWSPGADLRKGQFDIYEPITAQPAKPDIVLLPLLGFTRGGARLGYGGGHYDTWFGAMAPPHPVAIGVAYAGQVFAHLPQDKHDVALHAICTPKEFIALARFARYIAP